MKIARKISFSFFITAALLASLSLAFIYYHVSTNVRKAIKQTLTDNAQLRVDEIELYLRMLKAAVVSTSKSVVLPKALKTAKEDPGYEEAIHNATKLLELKKEIDKSVYGYVLLDVSGKVVTATDKRDLGQDQSTDACFLGALNGVYVKDVFSSPEDKRPLMEVAAPVVDNNTGSFLGVLVARMTLDEINRILLNKTALGNSGELFLINKYSYMITPSRYEKNTFLRKKIDTLNSRLALAHKDKAHTRDFQKIKDVFFDYRGVPVFGTHELIPEKHWGLIAKIDASEALRPIEQLRVLFLIILCCVPLTAWLLGMAIAASITKPIRELQFGAVIIGKGNFDYKTAIRSQDEVGELSRAFDAMAENLKNKTTSIENLDREVSERKLLERISLENSLFLQKLMDSIPAPVFYKDISGIYIGCNTAFETFFGIPRKQLVGKKVGELFPPEIAAIYREKDDALFALPGVQIYEMAVKNANGELRNIVFQKATFTGPSGEVHGIIGVIMDITLRKQAEKLLRESEEYHRVLFESSTDALMTLELSSSKFTTGNQAAVKMFKVKDMEAFTSLGPLDLSPERQPDGCSSAEKAEAMTRKTIREGSAFFEWMHRRVDGENFPATVLLTRVEIKDKQIIQATVRDISSQKTAEMQVRKLSQAMEQSPSCVVITDKNGKIEYVNQKFVELTGYSRAEVMGQNPRILKSGEQPPEFYKDLWKALLSGKDWQGQFCNKKKNGKFYWEFAHIAPIRDEKGNVTHFVAIKEDITYQRQIEEQLRRSLRMETVGRLAGGIAHDFNNMLTVINGYSGYLMSKMKPEDPFYDKVREIRDAGDCAATIVRQLLNLSRTEAPHPQLIKVADATKKIEHMINRLLGEDVELKVKFVPETGYVRMDPGQMEQIFLNLLVNAREAMPHGGVLTVTTDVVRMEEIQEEIKPSIEKAGDFIRISVQDTGTGIDPALKDKIFEPFFTTKKRGMNTGLGLSIIYDIVEHAGGAISLESQLGKGTTFKVYLPKAQEVLKSEESRALEKLPPGQGKILLVEDEGPVREFALQVLRERGYEVCAECGGEEALAMVANNPGKKFDLLLTDLTMPKMNGKEFVTRIRQVIPELKVIFMSGYSEQRVSDMKNVDFLQKPFSHEALSVKVFEVLGR